MTMGRTRLAAGLGLTQTIAWASTYYLPAIIAEPMARDCGTSLVWGYAVFSLAVMASAIIGPLAGLLIDRAGGRITLTASNMIFAIGLAALSQADSPSSLLIAWLVLGVGMGFGLYEAAFASISRVHGSDSRRLITAVTLIAGFASTVGWPMTGLFEVWWGWRGACLAWAAIHLIIAMPVNLLAIPSSAPLKAGGPPRAQVSPMPESSQATVFLLAIYMCLMWFVSTGIAVHLPRIIEQAGVDRSAAIAAASLVGPAQVLARVVEITALQRISAFGVAIVSAAAHPAAVGVLGLGSGAAAAFSLIHGAGNGLFTITRGILPLAVFGPNGYGFRLNLLLVPARITQAAAPFVLGLAIDAIQNRALFITAFMGGCASLIALRLSKGT